MVLLLADEFLSFLLSVPISKKASADSHPKAFYFLTGRQSSVTGSV
jgi:hypothetical protein